MVGRGWLVVLFAVCLLTAGCAEMTSESDTTLTSDRVVTETATPIPSPTPTETQTLTETPEPVDPDNPYGKETLVVGLNDSSSRDVNRTDVILSTLSYWEGNSSQYADYTVTFRFNQSARNPDIEIQLVDSIPDCGVEPDSENVTLGCAPIPEQSARTPVEVRIVNDFIDISTERILKHELGHALGLDHDDEPETVMAESLVAYPSSLEYTYHVTDDTGRHHPGGVNQQLAGAEEFLETGGGGTIASKVSVTEVANEADADLIVVLTDDERACPGDDVVCSEGNWSCLDEGDCKGRQSGVTLKLVQIKTDAIGWVTAYELFRAIAIEQGALEWPAELDSEQTDPTKTWWK